MDPTQDTSPHESALPNVSPQPQAGAGTAGAPPIGANQLAPLAAPPVPSVPSTPSAPANPAVSPPAPSAASSWAPPAAPGQSGNKDSGAGTPQAPKINVSAPAIADDGDVIEKEWVEKAKQIVARTRQDPYNQTKELHKFKAEYMQKRYNKTIEAVEE
jgi:hypothetical protein